MARSQSYAALVTDLTRAIAAWEEQYVSEASFRRYQRAAAWVVDQSAKAVSLDMRAATDAVFQDPTPWMRNAWQYRRSLGKGRTVADEVQAEAYVLDDQSAVLKYSMGDRRNERLPGDVGLAQDRILVPHWRNLRDTQGIRPTGSHDLPGATMARIVRNSQGVYARRSVPGRWGVYRGEVQVGGSRLMGYIARPPRVRAPVTDAGIERSRFVNGKGKARTLTKMVNLGRPRILLVSLPRAEYRPVMQPKFEDAVMAARRSVADLMAAELAENIRHRGYQAARGRLGELMARASTAIDRGDGARADALMDQSSRLLSLLNRGGR